MKQGLQVRLSRRELLALVLLLTLAALPHVLHLQPWISLFFISMLGLRLLALHRPALLPGRWLLFLLTLTGVGIVLSQYPVIFGKDAGAALLTAMLGLKLLEARRRRDVYVLVFLGFFILVTQFLFFRGIPILLHALLISLGLVSLLLEVSRAAPSANLLQPVVRALSLLAQAIPVMVVLFLLFPRFSSPLWNLGPEQDQALTGVSDRLSPGSVSRLARSRAVAFRVDFEGELPATRDRYWRGRVIWETDGIEWWASTDEPAAQQRPVAVAEAMIYHVTLEPAPGNWLYSLDRPLQAPRGSALTGDLQLLRATPVRRRVRYKAVSAIDYPDLFLDATARQKGLQLPQNISPRMRQLVAGWRSERPSDRQLMQRALAFFRNQAFYYTLYPPRLDANPADQFLFDSRRGFCEHYATSFALLMRIAGIPSRLVVGYQGGELNPLGDYLIIRQSDAHAWTEIWLQGAGWTRVDPTAAVAPQRIEQSLDPELVSTTQGAPIDFIRLDPGPLRQLLRQLVLGIDAVNSGWQRWVLGYSRERQQELMRMLGLGFLKGTRLALAMVISAAILVGIMSLLMLHRGRARPDPAVRAYRRFCQRLTRCGIARHSHEGPRDYCRRVAGRRPDLAAEVKAITRLYIGLRYGQAAAENGALSQLNERVRRFRPGTGVSGRLGSGLLELLQRR